jgi:hypothetical protein
LAVLTVTAGGSRSGRVAYSWTEPRPTFGSSTGRALRVVSSPMLISKSPSEAPTTDRSVLTETVSLASKRLLGTKLTPLPSEWASILPVWLPLREPRTVTVPRAAASPPRNEIVVFSPAVSVPGTG